MSDTEDNGGALSKEKSQEKSGEKH
jgi:hypothetical protein